MSTFHVDMIVEIPYNSYVKYEYDKIENKIRCDRILNTAMNYPGNYGYIPNTLSGDGDPLDILVITEYQLYPGIIIEVKIIGVLLTEDEKGQDEKIIAVPSYKVDPNYRDVNNYNDLPKWTITKIQHFFEHYKDNEDNKWVKVTGFRNSKEAIKIYQKSII
jgi:inorganic pyrophosphatase